MISALFKRFPIKLLSTMENGSAKTEVTKKGLRLVWVDCEMTGLPADCHRLVEIACIVTEGDLTPVAEFGPVAILQPPEVMDGMTDWCKETFAKNGLIERIKASDKGERETEKMVLAFLREHTPPGECLLAGSSVGQDQVFLRKYMPELCTHLHPYRVVDVTSVKELAKRWYEDTEEWKNLPPKKEIHLALDDIRESINVLQYCRQHFFRK